MANIQLSRRGSRGSLSDSSGRPSVFTDEENSELAGWEPYYSSRSQSTSDVTTISLASGRRFSDKSSSSVSSSSTLSNASDSYVPATGARPTNFGLVMPGFYRSSYPKPENYSFLHSLRLKTVVTLVKRDELDHDLDSFVSANGIQHIIFNMKGTKKEPIPLVTMRSILELVLDRTNYPLLLHCNQGKHRTGCVVAAVRKLSGWQLDMVVDEYRTFAEPKIRDCDVDYINDLDCTPLQSLYAFYDKPPARSVSMRLKSFIRILLFSVLVMLLWFVSTSRMPLSPAESAWR